MLSDDLCAVIRRKWNEIRNLSLRDAEDLLCEELGVEQIDFLDSSFERIHRRSLFRNAAGNIRQVSITVPLELEPGDQAVAASASDVAQSDDEDDGHNGEEIHEQDSDSDPHEHEDDSESEQQLHPRLRNDRAVANAAGFPADEDEDDMEQPPLRPEYANARRDTFERPYRPAPSYAAPVEFSETAVLRELDRLEQRNRQTWAGFIVNHLLPGLGFSPDEARQVLKRLSARELVMITREPNPKNPDRPASFVRINRAHPRIASILAGEPQVRPGTRPPPPPPGPNSGPTYNRPRNGPYQGR